MDDFETELNILKQYMAYYSDRVTREYSYELHHEFAWHRLGIILVHAQLPVDKMSFEKFKNTVKTEIGVYL